MSCTSMMKVEVLAWSVISKSRVRIEPTKLDGPLITQGESAESDLGGQ